MIGEETYHENKEYNKEVDLLEIIQRKSKNKIIFKMLLAIILNKKLMLVQKKSKKIRICKIKQIIKSFII